MLLRDHAGTEPAPHPRCLLVHHPLQMLREARVHGGILSVAGGKSAGPPVVKTGGTAGKRAAR
eukprot:125090-Lingulodinium_polyedra.AAC.1